MYEVKMIRETPSSIYMKEFSCSTCKHLNKSRKKTEYNFFHYGCKENEYVPVGIRKDLDSKEQEKFLSASCCSLYEIQEAEQMKLF